MFLYKFNVIVIELIFVFLHIMISSLKKKCPYD